MEIKIIPPGHDLSDPQSVRTKVFIQEQGFTQEQEYDEMDEKAYHVVVYQQGKPIATSRFFPSPKDPLEYRFGRIAVLKEERGKGYGNVLLQTMEEAAKKQGATSLWLDAQIQATPFYQKQGFVIIGTEHLDGGVPHIEMEKRLVRAVKCYPGDDLTDAYSIRQRVFVEDRGYHPEEEFDEQDQKVYHIVLYKDQKPIGTGRLFPYTGIDREHAYRIGRVAILKEYQGQGLGRVLMKELEDFGRELGAEYFWLNAQDNAVEFYRHLGYQSLGVPKIRYRIPHTAMGKEA